MEKMGMLIMCILLFLLVQVYEPKVIVARVRNCGPNMYTIVENRTVTCWACLSCPPALQTSVRCGSSLQKDEQRRIECIPCPKGTYSDSYSSSSCKRCKECEPGSVVRRECGSSTDTECVSRKYCRSGFYFSEFLFDCLPCSRCCDDGKDIKIDECATQGSQSKKLCSVRSFHRCSKDVDVENPTTQGLIKQISYFLKASIITTPNETNISGNLNRTIYKKEQNNDERTILKSIELILVTSLSVLFCILVFIMLFFKLKCSKMTISEAQCFPPMRLSKSKTIPDMCKSDQSDELEDWSNNDISISTYSFRCGVTIEYDPDCKQDRYKNLIVEPLSDKYVEGDFKTIKTGALFLSPIYRFYSRGEKFENKVRVHLPHSALWSSENKNWDIDILCMDERKGKDAKWDKITDGVEVNWKDASFCTDTMLTFVVVGKPLKGAKKRMQFVLFTTAEMISDLFEVCIYLLDDNETSFQNILKENSSKGFTMLGSFYAAFVDCHSSVDINLNIEGLLDGWELARLHQKSISNSACKESYFSIPSFQAAFRRVKRHADKFSCKFRINVAEKEIIIPAFTFVPEEELCVVVDVHDQGHDTSLMKEKTTLFKDLHYDTRYVAGRVLDVSFNGQGTWRQLGCHFGLTADEVEQFSVEYRTLEGSPSRALFDYLSTTQPNITVGEFVKCLESLGREDVLAVIYKHLKKKPVNTEV